MFRQNFKYISAKCNFFFFHRRLKKEETEAVTKKPTKESTAKVENDEEASGSSWWDMGYSSLLNKAVSSVSNATTAAALNAAELAKQKVQVNLCQKLLFLHQLTQNMTTDLSLQACRPWVCRVCHGTPRFWQIS